MDVVDQLGAVSKGLMSRRKFVKELISAGVVVSSISQIPQRASASSTDHATYFTWGGYDDPRFFKPYQDKRGGLPTFSIFGDEADMVYKLRGGFQADVVHPCHAGLPIYVETGLFQPIDTARLSNWRHSIPEFVDLPGNAVSSSNVWMAPCDWGQNSITYRTDLFEVSGDESWDMLWDNRYTGRLATGAFGPDLWWSAAIKEGIPFSEIGSEDAFGRIATALREQRPLIRTYSTDSTSLEQAIASGEVVAAMTENSSAVHLKAEGVPVKFAKPREGTLTWVCGLMLQKDAPNVDAAYDVINSLLSVETGKIMIAEFGVAHNNQKSFDAFDDDTLMSLNLSRDPSEVLKASRFPIPQSLEWNLRVIEESEKIKSGF